MFVITYFNVCFGVNTISVISTLKEVLSQPYNLYLTFSPLHIVFERFSYYIILISPVSGKILSRPNFEEPPLKITCIESNIAYRLSIKQEAITLALIDGFG